MKLKINILISVFLICIILSSCSYSKNTNTSSDEIESASIQEKEIHIDKKSKVEDNAIFLLNNYEFNLNKPFKDDLLKNLNINKLELLRNSIYAKHGYIFSTKKYSDYFSKFSWYRPTNKNVESLLSDVDNENIKKITNLEKRLKKLQFKSDKLGFSIAFPLSWEGRYKVVEDSMGISVYFKLPKNMKVKYGEFLFAIINTESEDYYPDTFDTIGNKRFFEANNVTYCIGGPTDFAEPKDPIEKKLFIQMNSDIPDILETIQVLNKNNLEITYTIDEDANKVDLYLKNMDTGKKELFKTLYDVVHYYCFEYQNNNLYLVREIKHDKDSIYELWKYDTNKKGTKIYSSEYFDFKVSPNQKYIAIECNNELIFIDSYGEILKKYSIDELKVHNEYKYEFYIGLLDWSDDSKSFWGNIYHTVDTYSLYKIDIDSYEIEKFDVLNLPMVDEYSLNPNNEMLVYSDYPPQFDVDSYNDFRNSKEKVNLYVCSVRTKNSKKIETSLGKEFLPKWIDNTTIEYENPKGENRITYTLTDGIY